MAAKKRVNLKKLSYEDLMEKLQSNLTLLQDKETTLNDLKEIVSQSKEIYSIAQKRLKEVEIEVQKEVGDKGI